MTLRAKLLLAQLPLALALVFLGVVARGTVSSLGERAGLILEENYRSVLAAQRMKESIERLDSAALFLVAGHREEGLELAAVHRPIFERELGVEERNVTEAGEGEAARELRSAWERYRARFRGFAEVRDPERSRALYFEELEPGFRAVKEAADAILTLNQDAMVRQSEEAARAAHRLDALVTFASVAALAAGVAASAWMTSRLLRPLAALGEAVRRVGEGDLDARVRVAGRDEIAALGAEFDRMADRLAAYRRSSLGELLQAQQAAQSAIDSIPDPVVVFDLDGTVLSANRAATGLLGISLDPAAIDPLAAVDPAARSVLDALRSHVAAGRGEYVPSRGFEEAVRVSSVEGDRWLLPRATPVRGEGGEVLAATVILLDVTRLRRFDELRNDLVSTVAHEFRTPLTSLRLAIHLCVEEAAGPLHGRQADLLSAAREDCERLQSIVDDLLDLARMQAGRVELRARALGPGDLAETAVRAARDAAETRRVDLASFVEPGTPEVRADPERVQIALGNLLHNAIRHTPEGGRVVLGVHALGGAVRFEVVDTGPGIGKEHLPRLFERFYRVPGGEAGSAGLGLSIVREIAEAHGGRVGVESEPGQGSTFWLTLPMARGEAEGEARV
ncbi:ATP-binding protein [Myxococcota bacterium]|nr:ATP-binding protein [Myxococcota bacterium]